MDDDEMQNRPTKAKEHGWGHSKGLKLFGPVNNMIGTTRTKLFCACHVSLMGESALDSFKHMLLSISRVKLVEKTNLQGTTMHGDRGCNDGEHFDFCDDHDTDSVNAVKGGLPLPFVFGSIFHLT